MWYGVVWCGVMYGVVCCVVLLCVVLSLSLSCAYTHIHVQCMYYKVAMVYKSHPTYIHMHKMTTPTSVMLSEYKSHLKYTHKQIWESKF